MKYVYAVLLLHSSGKEITEDNVKKVLSAAGTETEEARVKSLVTSLSDIDIDEALKTAAAPAAPAQTTEATKPAEEKKKEDKKEEKKKEEALAGLGGLFG